MQGHLDFKRPILNKPVAKKRIFIAVGVLLVLAFIIFLFARANGFFAAKTEQSGGKHGRNAGDGGAPIPVTVATAKTEVLPLELRNIGNVEAFSIVNVIAQVGGQLTNVCFTQGQYVKKGDLLFEIDSRPYEAQLAQAEANVARDRSQINSAQANLSKDQAMVRQAQANLDKDMASQNYADVEVQRYLTLVKEGLFHTNNPTK